MTQHTNPYRAHKEKEGDLERDKNLHKPNVTIRMIKFWQ